MSTEGKGRGRQVTFRPIPPAFIWFFFFSGSLSPHAFAYNLLSTQASLVWLTGNGVKKKRSWKKSKIASVRRLALVLSNVCI